MYSDDGDDEWAVDNSYTDAYGEWKYTQYFYSEWKRQVDVRAGVLCQVEALNHISIYGLTQPVEAIWELIPFSFIVDWFFNVGNTIGSWTPEMGTKTLASWYVINNTTYQKMGRFHDDFEFPEGDSLRRGTAYSKMLSNCWCDRTTVTKERVPSPIRAVVPTFSLRLDTLKLVDLLIIAKKLLGGGLKTLPMGLRT
jgi:hypothetical protein